MKHPYFVIIVIYKCNGGNLCHSLVNLLQEFFTWHKTMHRGVNSHSVI